MPVSPFDRDVNPPRSGDGAGEQRRDAAAGREMRASPRDEPEGVHAEETPEEPGYGHGV